MKLRRAFISLVFLATVCSSFVLGSPQPLPDNLHGTVSVLPLQFSGPSKLLKYSVAVFRVPVSRHEYVPVRSNGRNESDTSDGKGLTRLQCEHLVFDSFPHRNRNKNKKGTPVYLYPLGSTSDSSITKGNETDLLYTALHAQLGGGGSGGDDLEFGLLLRESVEKKTAAGLLLEREAVNGLAEHKLSKCKLRFLSSSEQSISPSGHYVNGDDGSLSGKTVSFTFTDTVTNAAAVPKRTYGERVSVYHSASKIVVKPLDCENERNFAEEEDEYTNPDGSVKHCNFNPDGTVLLSEKDMVLARNPFNAIKGAASPMIDPLEQGIGSMVGGTVVSNVANSAVPGLSDDLSNELTRAIGGQVTEILVPSLGETVPDIFPPMLAAQLSDYLGYAVSTLVTETVTKQVTAAIADVVPKTVDVEAPRRVARVVGRDIG